jgi:hypothetical protein
MFNDNLGTPALTLNITSSVNTSGTISGATFSSIPFTVTANTVTTVTVPSSLASHTSNVVDSKGIHVTAANDVTVYGVNYITATADAFMGLPTDVLGTDYVVMTYKNSNIVNGNMFGVVGTVNGTTVTITPSSTVGTHTSGVPYTVTLNQGETYELIQTSGTGDLTGTMISSTSPVGVFGASECGNIPGGFTFCDHLTEMLPPTTTWGKKFGTVPLASRTAGDTWRILASQNSTNVTINGAAQPTLNAGQFQEIILTGQTIVESDKPVLVAQFANGSSFSGNPGDPFMMLIPPLEQFLGDYTVINVTGYVAQFINIIAPNAIVGSITMDGVPIPTASYTAIGASGYSGAKVTSSTGSHHLAATQPFGVFTYGFNTDDAYGYPGGQSFAPIATATSITLSPLTGTDGINNNHCWTAVVTDQNNQPLAGIVVHFDITGANPGSTGFATTDASGVAQFCYAGVNPGQDNIVASVGTLTSSTATFTWTSGCNVSITGCPSSQTVYTGPGNYTCSQTATWTPPTDASNCPNTTVTTDHQPGSSFPVGTTPVTYTFTNGSGTWTCTFNVTVVNNTSCAIAVTPANNTYTGGVPTNIYIGYGPQSATISTTPGGSGNTYSWSPGTYLSCTSCATPVFTPNAVGNYTYTVTITTPAGCTYTCSVTFCVRDIRVPNTNGKVYVCHAPPTNPTNTQLLSVATSAVPSHLLGHPDDHLGQCTDQPCAPNAQAKLAPAGGSATVLDAVKIYPNPNNGSFTVEIPYFEESAAVTVMDVQGKVITKRELTESDGNKIRLDLGPTASGMYFVEVAYQDVRFRVKLIVQ